KMGFIDFTAECYLGSLELYKRWMTRGDIRKNDILFTTEAPLGNVALVPDSQKYILSQRTILIQVDEAQALSPFVFQQLSSAQFQRNLFDNASGSTAQGIQRKKFEQLNVALPPLHEQRAIAETLSDVDALLSGLDRLIAKQRDLKQAAMQQLLTGQTRLPGFQGEWEVKRLGEIATLNKVNVLPSEQPERQFVHFSLPGFDNEKTANVELGATIGSSKFGVPPGAVLVSKLNPRIPRIWAPSTIPENAVASTEWLILTPRGGIDRSYLFLLCSSPIFCERMELAATGTTGSHQRISPAAALAIQISVVADPVEQTAITQVLSDMDAELAALEARREKTRQLKQGMMQELLTGRTRLV
ncbi:restriction endonuclease subunit S, partial [Hydrogenophaga sp.]|uniref:restriction endonuclease subunit S n=1 Tax=Hydrogenophaga sp. TaxID=1904254 RepID=UPI003AF7B295